MRITRNNAYLYSFGREGRMTQKGLFDEETVDFMSGVPSSTSSFWAQTAQVEEKKEAPAPAVISYDDQMIFWNYLNDVQYGKFDETKLSKANTWVIMHNGTWLIQKNNSGYYGCKKQDNGIPTLPKVELPEAFFELTYGKLPNSILEQIIAFFRDIMKRHNDAEAFIQVYWDKQENKYIINVPKQRISKASVHYDALENLNAKEPDRYVFVYECHSHNSMGAFWSGTDNADEKELRIYGVFGELNKDSYACKHRFFVGEEQVDLELEHVFDLPKAEEKKYLVLHNNKQYLVPGDKLQLDEKPKYIFTTAEGQTTYVPVEKVVLHKEKVEVPETWFTNINVPVYHQPSNYQSRYHNHVNPYKANYGKKDKDKRKPLTNYRGEEIEDYDMYGRRTSSFEDLDTSGTYPSYMKDPHYYSDESFTAEDKAIVETAEEIENHIHELEDLTNGFEDMTTTLMMIEALEAHNLLYTLKSKLDEYIDVGSADLTGTN